MIIIFLIIFTISLTIFILSSALNKEYESYITGLSFVNLIIIIIGFSITIVDYEHNTNKNISNNYKDSIIILQNNNLKVYKLQK